MHQIQEEMSLWSDLEYPLFYKEVINEENASHALIHNMRLSQSVKPEFPLPDPAIFGIRNMDINNPVCVWVNGGKVDNLVKANRMSIHQYSFVESMYPETMIKENKNIPV